MTSSIPAVVTAFGPYAAANVALRGAKISCAAANGRNSRPVCSGE